MSSDEKKPIQLGAEWKLVGGQVSDPDTETPQPVRVFAPIDPAEHRRRIAEKAIGNEGGNFWTKLGMRDDDTALAASRLAHEATTAVVRDSWITRKRLAANFARVRETAWAIAKEHAKDRDDAEQRAKDRHAGKDVPADLAMVLMSRALRIAEDLRNEQKVGRVAGRVFKEACKARPGTYTPEVTRALLLAAIHEEDAWGGTEAKARGRHYHAILELRDAWRECTGEEVTASRDGLNDRELPHPFNEFAEEVLKDQGVTLRQIRRALQG